MQTFWNHTSAWVFSFLEEHLSWTASGFTKFCYRCFFRSSRPEVFCRKGVHTNFTKFSGKHLLQSLFFNKVAALRPATLLKKRLCYRCFPVNFAKFVRTLFLTEQLRWLLLFLYILWKIWNLINLTKHQKNISFK